MAIFVDTNILVYAEDAAAGERQRRAAVRLAELWRSGRGVLSTLVLQEFYVTVTRKVARPLAPAAAREIVAQYLTWRIVPSTGALVVAASRLAEDTGLSFWDAAIVAAAMDAGCETLWTEDLQTGRRFGGLVVVNPLVDPTASPSTPAPVGRRSRTATPRGAPQTRA